jgi:choline kinase
VTRIHKSLDPQTAAGEYVGIMKLSAQNKAQLLASLEKMIAHDHSVYYEDAIQTMVDDHGVQIKKVSTRGLPVMEIDTPRDLEDAQELIKQIV